MAALGGLSALLIHVEADSTWAYAFALLATAVGALLCALTRASHREAQRVPQEAFIGIVYVVASAAAVLIANKVPGGGEAIEKTLTGSILWVNFKPTILKLAAVYAALGAFHYALRHRFLTISFHPEEAERAGWKIRWWDFWFYLSFGVVITLAVPAAGVLMVFSFLVVPAVVAFLFTRDMRRLAYIAWGSGALASILGLWLSLVGDLPTGPLSCACTESCSWGRSRCGARLRPRSETTAGARGSGVPARRRPPAARASGRRRVGGRPSRRRRHARRGARRVPYHGRLRPGPPTGLRAVPLPHRPARPATAGHAPRREHERPGPLARGR